MTKTGTSTRRTFLKAGALLAAPLTATGATSAIAASGGNRHERLEDEVAILGLHHAWLRAINTGGWREAAAMCAQPRRIALDSNVRSIAADPAGDPETIHIAPDRMRASGRFTCIVEIVTELPQDCTFAQMAHAQGGGSARTSERRALNVDYVNSANGWRVLDFSFS